MPSTRHNPILLHLGASIRRIRKRRRFTQESLALEVGIDRSYLGGLERGERNPSILTLARIAATLKCTLPQLTKGLPNG